MQIRTILKRLSLYLAITFLLLSVLQWTSTANKKTISAERKEREKYDPGFMHLNSIESLTEKCRKELKTGGDSMSAVLLIDSLLKHRFVHGYSRYTLHDNYLIFILSETIDKDISAKIIPDHIMQEPEAACSQQAIVFMEVLKGCGFNVRKVGLHSHFCSEVQYNNAWHFFDTNQEADFSGLGAIPGIKEMMNNRELIFYAYRKSALTDSFALENAFDPSGYVLGEINEFPAKNMKLLHQLAGIFSHILWLVFLIPFLLLSLKKK